MNNVFLSLQDAFNRSKAKSDGKTYVPVALPSSRVFTEAEEEHIVEYTILVAKMFYGLPKDTFRKMVYQYAVACKKQNIPNVWEETQSATRDWYYAFMDRHPQLVLKEPEGMSISRIVAFNKVNVDKFFDMFTSAMEKYQFTPDRIYNLDESALPTVMKPSKVVCARGLPVAAQVSQERGETMTFVGIVNAVGQALPPVFIIPRKKWNPAFMRNTTFGSKGIFTPTGWMNGEVFVQTLEHVKERTGCSVDNKICLIIDNAKCHLNIHVVEYAENNGIKIVTLPPHTTDKLQPLDVSVFAPFKACLKREQTSFNLMHPNERITVHQLPELACEAWTKAANPQNILSGFRATGIWPINQDIFPEDAFVAAEVTERVAPPEISPVEVSPTPSECEGEAAEVQTPQGSAQEPPPLIGDAMVLDDAVVPPPPFGDTGTPSHSIGLATPELPIAEAEALLALTTTPVTPTTPTSSRLSVEVAVPLTEIRPLPKAPARPYGKGRKRVSRLA